MANQGFDDVDTLISQLGCVDALPSPSPEFLSHPVTALSSLHLQVEDVTAQDEAIEALSAPVASIVEQGASMAAGRKKKAVWGQPQARHVVPNRGSKS